MGATLPLKNYLSALVRVSRMQGVVCETRTKAWSVDEKAGTADWGDYVSKHSVENIGNTTVIIVLTEIKSLE
jgi:hypothetical protein